LNSPILFAQQNGSAIMGLVCAGLYFGLIILTLAGIWMTFVKAGKPGWASIVPIYNIVVLLEITGKPLWWILLFLIPFVNIVIAIIVTLDLAKVFGKGVGFGLGLVFLPFVFYPMLGFGDARVGGPRNVKRSHKAVRMPRDDDDDDDDD
jgi:hypothetical protein